MATGIKIVMTFKDNQGKTSQVSISHANPAATAAQVRAMGEAYITNTSIFPKTLTSFVKAVKVSTTEDEYDIQSSRFYMSAEPASLLNPPSDPANENQVVNVNRIG